MATAFTDTAHTALAEARDEATRLGHDKLGTEHLLLGLINAGGDAVKLLSEIGLDPDAVYVQVEKQFPAKARQTSAKGRLEHTPLLKKVIDCARDRADYQGKDKIGTDHLLFGMLAQKNGGAAQVLKSLGADLSSIEL